MSKYLALLTINLFAFFSTFAQPVIQSFYPTSGEINSSVVLTGTGFNTVASNNIVFFGATKATVTASTATTITATVPAGATYQPITVTANNLTAYSALPFLVTNKATGAGVPFSTTSFLPKQDVITGMYPHGVVLADFNLDGKADLLVSKGSSGKASLLTNTSSGTTVSFASSLELVVTGSEHEGAATGDLDGDGKIDFVLTNSHATNSVSVFRNTTIGSSISFDARVDLSVVNTPYAVAIGDLDGDGKPDVVAVNSGTGANVISIFRNTSTPGSISFAERLDLDAGTSPYSIAVTDLDADGKPEIVITNQGSSSGLSVLKNSSVVDGISFQSPVLLSGLSGPFTVALGDLDGDAKPDLVAASAFANAIIVKRNISAGGVLSFSGDEYFTTGSYPEGVAITDFDGDGKPDLVASNNQSGSVSALRNTSNTGSITFASHIEYTVGAHPNFVACGDLDSDGRPDIIVANTSETYISVLKNIVGGNIAPVITSFTPGSGVSKTVVTIMGENFTGATSVKFGGISASSFTVNSSQNITAIVAQGAGGEVSVTTPTGTAVLAGFQFKGPIIDLFTPATGIYGTPVTITGKNFTAATEVMFGGIPALSFTVTSATSINAFVGNGATGEVSITTPNGIAARGGFSFGAPVIKDFTPGFAPVGAAVIIKGTNFSTTLSENTVFFGAVKATVSSSSDTQINVIVPAGATYAPLTVTTNHLTAYSSQSFSTSFSTDDPKLTTASFVVAGNYNTGIYPFSVYSSDLNDDGKPELITANAIGNSISIFKNMSSFGNLSFENKLDLPVRTDPKRIAIGDLDGDGKPDLAVINFNTGNASTVSVFRNTSAGGKLTFGTRTDLATGNGSLDVAIADINGDGKLDLVVTSGNSGFFSVFQNTTIGTQIEFAPKDDFILLMHPDNLVLADIDKDGKVDVITSNFSHGNLSVYRNTSTGGILSLDGHLDFPVNSFPGDVNAADLDFDGRLDLINSNNGQFTFLQNTSTPGSISFGNFRSIEFPVTNIQVGDLNGDGKPDLCMGQPGGGKISVYENTSTVPGNLELGANVQFTTGSSDTFVMIGDLDGDGKPEIAVVNPGLSTVTILGNRNYNPILTKLSATSARKGDLVSISGSNLTGAVAVHFGGTSVRSFKVVSSTRIDAIMDGGSSGDVTVTTGAGIGRLPGFRFIPGISANSSPTFCTNSSVLLSSTAFANNQWFKNGTAINGANGVTYEATTSGNYTVKTTVNGITTLSDSGIIVKVIMVPTPVITAKGTWFTSSSLAGNQWYFNGSLIPDGTEQTYRGTESGIYTVQVISNGCYSGLSLPYNFVLTDSIDVGNNQLVKLSPNPVHSLLTIQWNIPNIESVSVQIRDIHGKLALSKANILLGETLSLSALPNGTYFVTMLATKQHLLGTWKIVKVK